MKRQITVVLLVAAMAVMIFGCAGKKPPVMQDGKQVAMFILSDRGITSGMKEEEKNDRNEMGQGMEEEMVRWMTQQGYNATLIQKRDQYVQGSSNYLITVKIRELKLVGRSARTWLGMAAGPTILKTHYEVSGSGTKLALSYDDEESTVRDWMAAPQELTVRLWQKIDEKLVGTARK